MSRLLQKNAFQIDLKCYTVHFFTCESRKIKFVKEWPKTIFIIAILNYKCKKKINLCLKGKLVKAYIIIHNFS